MKMSTLLGRKLTRMPRKISNLFKILAMLMKTSLLNLSSKSINGRRKPTNNIRLVLGYEKNVTNVSLNCLA